MGRLSCHSSLFGDFSIEETCQVLKELDFDAIELNMETSPDFQAHVTQDASHEECQHIVETIRNMGLVLSSLSPHCDMIPPDAEERRQAVEFVRQSIDLAVDLETEIVHIASGRITEAGEDLGWRWMVEAVKACVGYGRDQGVKVGLEAGVFPGLIVWDKYSLIQLIERVGYDDFYVNFDPSHFAAAGHDPLEVFSAVRDRIINIHAKDGSGGSRENFAFPALGEGDVDWPSLANAVVETNYNGFIAVEYEAHFFAKGYRKDPLGAARHSKDFLDRVLAKWMES